jgi:hypothetical protein
VLPACGSDPDTTTSSETSGTATTGSATATTGENTDPTTGATGTGTGDTSTSEPGTTGTSEPGTTDVVTTGDTSTGGPDTTVTSDTGDTSTGGGDGLGQAAQDAAAALELAVDGVLYLSESEDTWTVFALAGAAPVTDKNVKDVIAGIYVPHDDVPLADRVVELRTLAQLMDPLTVMQDWWGDFEKMQAEDYKQIRAIFEGQLSNPQVFRLGEQSGNDLVGQVDVFVIGETVDGDLVGMFAIAVET